MDMRKLNRLFLCLSLALFVVICAPAAANAITTAPNTDAVLARQLQKELSDHFEFRNVTVNVDDRIATIQGSVESYRDKVEAEKLVRKHNRIDGIRDYVAVVPPIDISDSELQTKLADRLRYDRIGYGIQFNNLEVFVKNGVVTVRGGVRAYPDKQSALAILEDTPGVRDVNDEIQVAPLSMMDDDLRIRTAKAIYGDPVLRKYALDPQAPIRIIVEDGHVKLYGVVASDMDKRIAELRANEVSGAFSVENHLLVNHPREQKLAEGATSQASGSGGTN